MDVSSNSFDNDYAIGLSIEADLPRHESRASNDLDSFREQWKSEVAAKNAKSKKSEQDKCSVSSKNASNIRAAKEHFLRGVESERCGEMNNAIKSYRVALQLDPEIEQRLSELQEFSQQNSDDEDVDELIGDSSLLEKFNSLNLGHHDSSSNVLSLSKSLHIMQLPSEILCHIFRCVASSHVDMKSIESLSETCRMFYIHARDQTLWKAACEKLWGPTVNRKSFVDWRRMYIEKPHARVDGVYISKVTYFRQGDPTVLNANYEPFQCVVYYRYLRFFDNSTMLLHTTSDEPSVVIPRLTLNNTKQLQFRTGPYKSHSESNKRHPAVVVSAVLTDTCNEKYSRQYFKRATKSEKKYVLKESEYFVDLELTSSSTKRRFNKISWIKYSCRFKYADGHISSVSDINLSEQYSPFYFSKVKSFLKRATEPL